jgi:RNA polymerase sigma factor (sigma-70 family)
MVGRQGLAQHDPHIRGALHRGSKIRLRFAADERLVALVRGGDVTAFEILYDRHARELLSFCRHMLGSDADAEDAVQSSFASAHRALLADDRPVELRPWLFTIARNACLSILRARKPHAELSVASPHHADPAAQFEQREEMREMLATLLDLPEAQRVALVLSELHGFSQSEVGAVLGVRAEQVKSYVYQARSNLISEREARGADCRAIRQELASARGPALLKSRLRRHLRGCPDCQQYAAQLSRQRRQLGALLPVLPSLALKRRVLEAVLGNSSDAGAYAGAAAAGGSTVVTTFELAGGGAKVLISKLLACAACLGAGTGAATVVVGAVAPTAHLIAAASPAKLVRSATAQPHAPSAARAGSPSSQQATPASRAVVERSSEPLASTVRAPAPQARADDAAPDVIAPARSDAVGETQSESEEKRAGSGEARGKSEEPHGKSEEAPGRSEEPHGKSEEAPGRSEEPHGKSEAPPGRSEEPHGKSEAAPGHTKEGDEGGSTGEEAPTNGKSEEAPGHSEEPHGKSEEAPGHSGEAHGKAGG